MNFLTLIFIRNVFGVIFEDRGNEHVKNGVVVYEDNAPSHLACMQKALYFKASAMYDGKKCTCYKETDNAGKELPGKAFEMVRFYIFHRVIFHGDVFFNFNYHRQTLEWAHRLRRRKNLGGGLPKICPDT